MMTVHEHRPASFRNVTAHARYIPRKASVESDGVDNSFLIQSIQLLPQQVRYLDLPLAVAHTQVLSKCIQSAYIVVIYNT